MVAPTVSAGARFRDLLRDGECLVTPGCHDALSARVAENAGHAALAISGFGVEAALLGRADIGLLSLNELVDQARRIARAVDVPVTCDGETGFGGVHNIARLVSELEVCGIAGVQIEDQTHPKRCPALDGRAVVSLDEQLERLGAALAARRDPDFLVIARSDADVISIDALVERCNRYLAAGADIAMPICFAVDGHSLTDLDGDGQMELMAGIARRIDGPVKAVHVPPGYAACDLGAIGYAVAGLTGGPIEAAVNALDAAYRSCLETGSEAAYRVANPPAIAAPSGIMKLLGIEADIAFERTFGQGKGR